jgi:hypothetical protein
LPWQSGLNIGADTFSDRIGSLPKSKNIIRNIENNACLYMISVYNSNINQQGSKMCEFIEYLEQRALGLVNREQKIRNTHPKDHKETLTDIFLERENIATALRLADEFKRGVRYGC